MYLQGEGNELGYHPKQQPDKKWKNMYDYTAVKSGLKDKYQLQLVQDYLWHNGGYTLVPVSFFFPPLPSPLSLI